MINSQNYIANIGGKPLIIAGKSNATGNTTGGQGLVLQATNSPNGTFILNSQGQQLKVQGNILTQVNKNTAMSLSISRTRNKKNSLNFEIFSGQCEHDESNSYVAASNGDAWKSNR